MYFKCCKFDIKVVCSLSFKRQFKFAYQIKTLQLLGMACSVCSVQNDIKANKQLSRYF